MSVAVIGAGLAGCEAAWALAQRGIAVTLYEMKPQKFSPAHHNSGFAELVCSNSLKAARLESAAGLLKAEMRKMGSLILACADQCAVPAGGALAVDRDIFSALVTEKIRAHPLITVIEGEVTSLPGTGAVIVATGPLTSDALSDAIAQKTGAERLSFYDAAAPIVEFSSIDMTKAFFAARYGRGEDDYINCPMNKVQYETFLEALTKAERAELHSFEKLAVYEGCMPVEVLASRGKDAIRYGPMKPVGLTDPATGHRPWAVVQLRAENREGTLYNLVGFQTNLKFGEQKRVFSLIPGLENAVFARYGVMHRNTFIDSPRLLDIQLRLLAEPRLRFAGQITGVEGYIESAASGIWAGISLAREINGQTLFTLPRVSMLGALLCYITDSTVKHFQPMGSNMGILPPLEEKIRDKQARYLALAERSMQALETTTF
ncbi:methylenetetrahydrofolate--tRNA-(uracil(54)-C(5))-methyltransferase (FADH(2)-oxidizing) TrmFO [Oscillospiraceae bacterium LTW-04]|nr:methylenetetrahydrofolate--tRNA-(uracil(54)-C(5))-methyltransferase (FADH(2)-oxidizing) TrmFO [Oscillospiraceae bacterium MB24-C1]